MARTSRDRASRTRPTAVSIVKDTPSIPRESSRGLVLANFHRCLFGYGFATRSNALGHDTIARAAGVCDIFDFLCFKNNFVSGDPYACDCDTTTGNGVCDVFDSLCFQNAFVGGCP